MSSGSKSNPITHAWDWSVEHSPILCTTRWIFYRGYPNAKSRELLRQADLPRSLDSLIDTTITKTRLWSNERRDIAREFIAHTQDALDAGRSAEEIIENFGDPKRVARLLRRSMKRKRPLYWRTLRNARRGVGVVVVMLLAIYSIQAARFFTGEPNITTNYAQRINAGNDEYSEDQKGWPIYREIDVAWQLHTLGARKQQIERIELHNRRIENEENPIDAGLDSIPSIPLDHPQYAETAQLSRDFEPSLKRLREAMHRPIVGITLGFDSDSVEVEAGVREIRTIAPSDDPAQQETLIGLLLPHLGKIRQFANLLSFDAKVAARDGDSQRTYEDLSAMLALSNQQSFDNTIITDLVNIAIYQLTTNRLLDILNEHPGLLSREQLVAMAHEHASIRSSLRISFEGELMMFDDVMQRAYTDDGNGNGHLTPEGMHLLNSLWSGSWGSNGLQPSTLEKLSGPIALTIAYDRRSLTEQYRSMLDTIRKVQDAGPELLPLLSYQESVLQSRSDTIETLRYSPVDILMPALGSAVERTFQVQMVHNAVMTMLVIEVYTIDHGSPPESLSQLTPHYFPEIPRDLFDPGQSLKYTITQNGYAIYSVGSDGDDDAATPYPTPDSDWGRRQLPRFGDRFPYQLRTQGGVPIAPDLNPDGTPKAAAPKGPDGDWVIVERTLATTQEPDQRPAPEYLK